MNVQTIDEYLKSLESYLQISPKKDRDFQIAEVKDHLLQSLEDYQFTEIEVIYNFLSPNELYGPVVTTNATKKKTCAI